MNTDRKDGAPQLFTELDQTMYELMQIMAVLGRQNINSRLLGIRPRLSRMDTLINPPKYEPELPVKSVNGQDDVVIA
jgi:hypothetical protein